MKKRGWNGGIRCEESSALYWKVYNEMNGTSIKPSSDGEYKKRGRFSNKTK